MNACEVLDNLAFIESQINYLKKENEFQMKYNGGIDVYGEIIKNDVDLYTKAIKTIFGIENYEFQHILKLRHIEHHTNKEIAKIIGKSPKTVERLYHQARENFNKLWTNA